MFIAMMGGGELARAGDRGRERCHTGLDMPRDVLDHHDAVVNDRTTGQDERQQGQQIERVAEHQHDECGANER
jgi:hypothetical protein